MKKMQVKEMVMTSIFVAIILVQSLVPGLGYITFIPGVSALTIVPITVLVGISLLNFRSSVILGFTFGIGSLIASLYQATTPIDLAFRNPMISVLPRVLFAIAAYYLYRLLGKLDQVKHGHIIVFGTISLITVLGLFYGFNAISNVGNYNGQTRSILQFIALLLAALFLTMYYYFTTKNKDFGVKVPSTVIVSMLIHTFFVILALIIFKPAELGLDGDFSSAMTFLYTLIVTNGLIEAVVTVIVVTPIVIALSKLRLESTPTKKELKSIESKE